MFTGSVCAQVREWFKSNATAFAGKRVLCGCSGNFTIETVLSQVAAPPAEIISNDVSLYSSALGAFYTSSESLHLTIEQDQFERLRRFLGSTLDAAATMVVMLGLAPFAKGKTPYHRRHVDIILGEFEKYHEIACAKLKARKSLLRISEYRAEDVKHFLSARQNGEIFLSFMPTHPGGNECRYKFLDDIFCWPGRPKCEVTSAEDDYAALKKAKKAARDISYRAIKSGKLIKPDICPKCGSSIDIEHHHEDYSKPLDVVWLCIKCHAVLHGSIYETGRPDNKQFLLNILAEKGNYVHVDNVRREGMNIVAIVEGGRSTPVFIHSDIDGVESQVYSRAKQRVKRPSVPILGPEEEAPDSAISLVMLNADGFAWFRDQYLSQGITPADPQWRFGVCVGGKLVGVIGWKRNFDGNSYYLMCDVALPSSRYKRLSKLICMVANSHEMMRALRQQTGRFWTTFRTTAFTRRAVSMKYRGVLDLLLRDEKKGWLIYEGRFTWTLKKAVKKWQKLEAKDR